MNLNIVRQTQQAALADVFRNVYEAHESAEARCRALATVSLISQECAVVRQKMLRDVQEEAAVIRELVLLKALAFALLRLEEKGCRAVVDEIVGMIDHV